MAIADRLAVMQKGRIVQVGCGEALYHRPEHPFVAQFLGRVNLIERSAQAQHAGTVELGGLTLTCPPHLRHQPQLLLRPEDITLQASLGANTAHARVSRRVFLGDRVQLHLATDNQPDIRVEHAGLSPFREGDPVTLAIDTNRLLPAHEA